MMLKGIVQFLKLNESLLHNGFLWLNTRDDDDQWEPVYSFQNIVKVNGYQFSDQFKNVYHGSQWLPVEHSSKYH